KGEQSHHSNGPGHRPTEFSPDQVNAKMEQNGCEEGPQEVVGRTTAPDPLHSQRRQNETKARGVMIEFGRELTTVSKVPSKLPHRDCVSPYLDGFEPEQSGEDDDKHHKNGNEHLQGTPANSGQMRALTASPSFPTAQQRRPHSARGRGR